MTGILRLSQMVISQLGQTLPACLFTKKMIYLLIARFYSLSLSGAPLGDSFLLSPSCPSQESIWRHNSRETGNDDRSSQYIVGNLTSGEDTSHLPSQTRKLLPFWHDRSGSWFSLTQFFLTFLGTSRRQFLAGPSWPSLVSFRIQNIK